MKAFVTGGTGYLGSHLIKKLLQNGYRVHALCRGTVERELMQHPQLKWFEGDVLNLQSIMNAMHGCNVVFHTAAYVRGWSKNPELFYQVNTKGTVNILESAMQFGVAKTIITSTTGVIGPSENNPSNENHIRLSPFNNDYDSSKFMAEYFAKDYALKGLNVCIVNPSRIYGPGEFDKRNNMTSLIIHFAKNQVAFIPGNGMSKGNFVFVDDVIDGHLLALEKGKSGERYIIGGENISFNNLFKCVNQVTGNATTAIHLPSSLMKAIAFMQLFRAKISDYEPLLIPAWVDRYKYDYCMDSSKAVNELGYRITPLQTGIEKTISWLIEKNLIKINSPQLSII